jgi:integrase
MVSHLKSHSFRVGYVTRHFKVADIQQTADLIGHKSLNTTRRYHRYFLDTNEKQSLNDQALDVE